MLFDSLIQTAASKVKHRLWIVSDLQQQYPERATHCMTRAAADFVSLKMPVEAVCYLGDAVEGGNMDFLIEMSKMQVREFSKVDAPVYYLLGNHDFDYFSMHKEELEQIRFPFKEYVQAIPQWHVQPDLTWPYFCADMGEYALCFLPDCTDLKGRWYTTHGEIRGDAEAFPYTQEDYQRISRAIADLKKPVITMSHYAFAGGNRAAPLFDRLLPLPENVRMHFYGHAHIGDAVWAGKDCHRKISAVDNQPVMQINVASLENYRGSAIRSVIVEWYEDDEIGVLFRNHSLGCWDDYLVVRKGDGQRAEQRND